MIHVRIKNEKQQREFSHPEGPIEFGRLETQGNVPRYVLDDDYVSKDHLRVEELDKGRIRIWNLSKRNPVEVPGGQSIATESNQDVELPIRVLLGKTLIDFKTVTLQVTSSDPLLETIARPVRAQEISGVESNEVQTSLLANRESFSPKRMVQWLETVVEVQKAAAGSAEFYNKTVRALVDLVGLDLGLVILPKENSFEVAARYGKISGPSMGRFSRSSPFEFSQSVVRTVIAEKRTFYRSIRDDEDRQSLIGLSLFVASPIFGPKGDVVGVLYGARGTLGPSGQTIGEMEAQIVQLLAAVAGTGLARMEKEIEANRARAHFEQVFTPELAQHLLRNPDALKGQEREVTVMFLDLRGFSRLSERIDPKHLFLLASDALDRITEKIREHDGVVVDYAGDGVLAMWNAPTDQPEHAILASRAALGILDALPGLNEKWEGITGQAIDLGIGMNTGPVLVGNAGTRHKLKYGPRGHAVNVGSRVEGATKQFGIPILMTESTHAALQGRFATRRLCQVQLVGIEGAVNLYQLRSEMSTEEWDTLCNTYEKALEQYESGQWSDASKTIFRLIAEQDGYHDMPSLNLLGRIVECLKAPPDQFDPVVHLSSK